MTGSFTMKPAITDPVAVINDMSLVCDRIAAMISAANSVLMEDVVERVDDGQSAMYRNAYNAWCTFQTAVEKLQDVGAVLGEAEMQLRVRARAEG
jgi:hypothetical protein